MYSKAYALLCRIPCLASSATMQSNPPPCPQLLETIATRLRPFGAQVLFYLAAAVSDFYVPWEDLVGLPCPLPLVASLALLAPIAPTFNTTSVAFC